MTRKFRALAPIDYYPIGVDPADIESDRVHADEGTVITDMRPEDGDGLRMYDLVEEVHEGKVRKTESESEGGE